MPPAAPEARASRNLKQLGSTNGTKQRIYTPCAMNSGVEDQMAARTGESDGSAISVDGISTSPRIGEFTEATWAYVTEDSSLVD